LVPLLFIIEKLAGCGIVNSVLEIVPFEVVEEFEFPLVGEIDSLSLGGVVRGCLLLIAVVVPNVGAVIIPPSTIGESVEVV
jgi:hypothetical protein